MKTSDVSLMGTLLLLPFIANPPVTAAQNGGQESAVSTTIDALHTAASEADFERYSSLFAENAIFLGTDATERWTREEFMAFTKPYFDRGRGWTYVPTERHVYLSADGRTAWFDERLDNAGLGETRGSGVLIQVDGEWKFSQYNLTIPVPNELASEFVARIRGQPASANNEAVVLAMVQAVNKRDLAALDTLVASDVSRRSGATPNLMIDDIEGFKEFLRQDFAAVPDSKQEITTMFSGADWVAVRAIYSGTQNGPMGPFPASGNRLELPFIGLLRVEDGLIREILVEWDNLNALTQLGHFPPANAAGVEE